MIPKRIGLLIPSTNTAVEADFQRALPDNVTAHSERLFIPGGSMTAEHLDLMNRDLAAKVELLATAQVDVMVYACTSGSFYRGASWDQEVTAIVEQVASVPCITTSNAVTEAFRALSLRSLSVITPYPDWTNERLVEYYQSAGLHITSVTGDPRAARSGHRAVNDQDPQEILRFGLDHCDDAAEALFCSCTAWRAMECVTEMESKLGRPVVTSNQATIWAALRLLDTLPDAPVYGRLFGVKESL